VLRILHIVPTAGIGGVSTNLLRLIDAFSKIDYEHEVCILGETGFLSHELLIRGMKLSVMGMQHDLDIPGAFRLAIFLMRNKYALVYVHYRSFLGSLMLAIFCRAKKIITQTGSELVSDHPWKTKFFYHLFGFQYDKVIAVSNCIKDALLHGCGLQNNKVVVIRHGIECEKFTGLLKKRQFLREKFNLLGKKKVVGILARIVTAKGIDIFMQVAQEVKKQDDNFIFVIAGDGPLLNRYRYSLEVAVLMPDIRFLGELNDPGDILPALDIFLFTSRWEAFGVVLLEAMAMGIPISAFSIPVVKEILTDEEDALLVEPFDIKEMARALLRIAYDDVLANRLSQNAKLKVQDKFSLRCRTEKIQGIYKEVINAI